jgi:hypothetical protein
MTRDARNMRTHLYWDKNAAHIFPQSPFARARLPGIM